MALPLSRNTTYIAGVTPPRAHDLNDLQDKAVAAWGGKHGNKTEIVPLTAAFEATGWTTPVSHNGWTATTTSSSLYLPLVLRDGDRLREVRLIVNRTGGAWTANLLHQNTAAGRDSSDYAFTPGITATTSAAGITELVLNAQDHYIGETYAGFPISSLLVGLTTTAVGNQLYQVKMTYDHP